MELQSFIDYRTASTSWQKAVLKPRAQTQLSEACRTYGIPAVRAFLRSYLNTVPQIVKLLETDDEGRAVYWTRIGSYSYVDDNGEFYYTLLRLPYGQAEALRQGYTHYLQFNNADSGYRIFPVDSNIHIIAGYNIGDWIEYGRECEDCGVPFVDYEDEGFCPRCTEQYQTRSYSHRVEDELGFEETKEIRFGVELEYEDITAKDVFKTLKGHALPKRDSSIDDGVEIVTRPACITTHKKHLENFFKQIKVQAYSNTGMHVHIERSKLSEYQIGFIMQFLNSKHLAPHIKEVAGRNYEENHYTRLQEEHIMTYGLYYDGKVRRNSTDKYSPLNTAKKHTVEVRIFSSPESAQECFARLDFVNALVKYSSPYSVSVKSLKDKFNWELFTQFVKNNRKEFPDYYNQFIKGAN